MGQRLASDAAAGTRDGEISALYSEFGPRLMKRLSRKFGAAREDAEDLVQEAFVLLWIKKPDSPCLPAWLSHVAGQLAIDLIRRRSRAGRYATDARSRSLACPETKADGAVLVREALWGLRPKARRILVLRYSVGLSEVAVGRAAGLAPSSVRRALHRARKTLRAFL